MANDGIDPKTAVDTAVKRWAFRAFLTCNNAAKVNLSGKVLKIDTGRLIASLDIVGRALDNGFKIGTNVVYGIAWELGFTTKDRYIYPRVKKALHFFIGNAEIFARRVHRLPKTYAARPFLHPAIADNVDKIKEDLGTEMRSAMKDIFPGGSLNG